MSDMDRNSLLKRIEELEMENKTAKKELHVLKKSMRSDDSHSESTGSNSHDFSIQVKTDVEEFQSMPHTINGVEFAVNIHRKMRDSRCMNDSDARFTLSWIIKNTDPTTEKFVLISTDGELAERPSSDQESIPLCRSFSHHFVLHGNEEYRSDDQRLAHINSRRPTWKITVRLTAVVQTLESTEIDVGNTAVVIVKNKEFRVSVDYLSMWSLYFRAYFRVDMKEKIEGRYPIGDEDIEPEDFQELMDVINPTSKAISKDNYFLLLRLANRFEMPSLTRRIELFMIEFDKNKIRLGNAFRIASDVYSLKIVQTMLLNRWRDPQLMEEELLKSEEYEQLSTETKALVHERFAEAYISSNGNKWNRAADQARRRAASPSEFTEDKQRRVMQLGRDRAGERGGFNNRDSRDQRGLGFNYRAEQNRRGFERYRDEDRGGFGFGNGAPPFNNGFRGFDDDRD